MVSAAEKDGCGSPLRCAVGQCFGEGRGCMKRWRDMWATVSVEVEGGFWFVLALAVLLFPLRFTAGVMIAAAIHELGHLSAIALSGGRVRSIRLHAGGARIEAAALEPPKELLCVMAGPAAGALCILAWRAFPELAAAALLQTAFNLLPIKNLDGGTILALLQAHNAD